MAKIRDKEVRRIVRAAEACGWTVEISTHLKWRDPSGCVRVSSSLTPSDVNAVRQLKRDLRRVGLVL